MPGPDRRRWVRTATAAGWLGLVALLTSSCLEPLSTTRIPAGAAQNFFYYLTRNEQADANAYWAPDHQPADAPAQVAGAAARLRDYVITGLKSDSAPQPDGSVVVTLRGEAQRKTASQAAPEQPLLRAHLIAIGPGWRVTDFTLLCCAAP
ncbi:MAG: hypothetical protein M3010_02840 [Candidatus Dormibacteraeota bacterium]|nr:hypothetical protein [Candidatus Dormibacteraeota bacterium]